MDIIQEAKQVFEIEIASLQIVKTKIGQDFISLVDTILQIKGRVILTGMGKSGHIAKKVSATLASLGTPSYFLHPAEAAHGDLGIINQEDLLIAMSTSGETEEILQLIPSIKQIGCKLVSMTGKPNSTLESYADIKIFLPIQQEAIEHIDAPTTSTTAMLVFGDALAVVLAKLVGFKSEHFALFHPKGALGKRLLLKVSNLMHTGPNNAYILLGSSFKQAIIELSIKALGAVCVISESNELVGLLTDGDLKRILEKNDCISMLQVEDYMTKKPIVVTESMLAVEALRIMEDRDKQISVLPVVDSCHRLCGMIRLHDIIKAGVICS